MARAFQSGAEDYIVRPFPRTERVARIQAEGVTPERDGPLGPLRAAGIDHRLRPSVGDAGGPPSAFDGQGVKFAVRVFGSGGSGAVLRRSAAPPVCGSAIPPLVMGRGILWGAGIRRKGVQRKEAFTKRGDRITGRRTGTITDLGHKSVQIAGSTSFAAILPQSLCWTRRWDMLDRHDRCRANSEHMVKYSVRMYSN